MSFVGKSDQALKNDHSVAHTEEEYEEEEAQYSETRLHQRSDAVTRHVYLKAAHSSQGMGKEEILRRIRQRKLVNRFKSTVRDFIRLPSQPKPGSVPPKKWVDDPFTAL